MIDREAFHQAMEVFYLGNGAGGVAAATLRAAITAYLTHAGEGAVPVGEAGSMTGTDGFTMAAFETKDVPIGTKLYTHPPRQDGACKDFCVQCTVDGCCEDCCHCSTRQDGAREGGEIAWESTTIGYIPFVTDARYRKFTPAAQRWYKPYRCSNCTTPPAPDEAVERLSEAAQREAIYSHVSAVPGVAKTAVRTLHAAGYEIVRSRRDVGCA